MIYIKKSYDSDLEMNIDVYSDEFYSRCPKCGKEVHLSEEMLKDLINGDCDFSGTSIYCKECSNIEQQTKGLKLTESQIKNRDVLWQLFNQVKEKHIQEELFVALDTYDQLVFNDLSEE